MNDFSWPLGDAIVLAESASRPATWGITGPAFLAIYGSLALAVVAFVYGRRRRLRDTGGVETRDAGDLEPCELAMLNGGDQLAVATAVANLLTRGELAEQAGRGDGDRFVIPQHDPANLAPLERAIRLHFRESPNATISALAWAPGPLVALGSLRARLTAEGLLLDEERRGRIRLEALWIVALIGLGVVRIVAGVENQKPVGWLVALVVALGVAALAWAAHAPLTTRRGEELLKSARSNADGLDKAVTTHDPRLGLALALFGGGVLWEAEPSLAASLGLPRSGGGGDGGGGGCGGGCGGCGG